MVSLEERLKEILQKEARIKHNLDGGMKETILFPSTDQVSSWTTQIIQAFKDELKVVVTHPQGDGHCSCVYDLIDHNYMTGQEWLERFEKELVGMDVTKISSAHDLYCGKPKPYAEGYRDGFQTGKGMLRAAAKRASGVSEPKEPKIIVNKYEGHK